MKSSAWPQGWRLAANVWKTTHPQPLLPTGRPARSSNSLLFSSFNFLGAQIFGGFYVWANKPLRLLFHKSIQTCCEDRVGVALAHKPGTSFKHSLHVLLLLLLLAEVVIFPDFHPASDGCITHSKDSAICPLTWAERCQRLPACHSEQDFKAIFINGLKKISKKKVFCFFVWINCVAIDR